MNTSKTDTQPITPSFFSRVANHDSAKKGLAAAGAGILIALISEAIWPTNS